MSAVTATPAPAPTVDLAAIKTKQQAAWSSGDYAVVGTTLQIVGETLCESLDLHAGEHVLDIAAGNGNATLAAARRLSNVVSTDYVPALLERGRARAAADGLPVTFQTADAENLPYTDRSFDVAMSTFGIMFTPDQDKAASEMARVVKSGGRIGLANWTPTGFIGELFKIIPKYIPPAPGQKSYALWGTEARLRELFAPRIQSMTVTQRFFNFRYLSAAHFLEVFRTYYGPMNKAFAALDADRQAALAAEVIALAEKFNRATDGTLVAPGEYLEAVITCK